MQTRASEKMENYIRAQEIYIHAIFKRDKCEMRKRYRFYNSWKHFLQQNCWTHPLLLLCAVILCTYNANEMDAKRRTREYGVINEQARIVCEMSLNCECVYFFSFSLLGGTYGKSVCVERSRAKSQFLVYSKGDWIVFLFYFGEGIKKKQPAYGMKCHKIATSKKKMKKKRDACFRNWQNKCSHLLLIFLSLFKLEARTKETNFTRLLLISVNMKVYTINCRASVL